MSSIDLSATPTGQVLAQLLAQGAQGGADLVTLRAIAEEAGELGATRALTRLGLTDAGAAEDVRELRELLRAWRDAKRSAWKAAWGWVLPDEVEAALLARLAAAAVLTAEAYCGTAIVARSFEDVLAVAPGWQRLAASPVTAIAGMTGLPVAAAPFVLPVAAYSIDIDADGDGWARVADADGAARVAVSYSAGAAANWTAAPRRG